MGWLKLLEDGEEGAGETIDGGDRLPRVAHGEGLLLQGVEGAVDDAVSIDEYQPGLSLGAHGEIIALVGGLPAAGIDSVVALRYHRWEMADLTYEGIELGREYGPWTYPLAERIDRYLEAVENGHPWYRERSPWGPPVVPPVVMANAALRLLETVGTPPPGTLQAGQELEMLNALRRDRRLVVYGRFADKFEKGGRRWFVFEARLRDETGLILGHSRATVAFPRQGMRQGGGKGRAERPPRGELTPLVRAITQERITAYSEDMANSRLGRSIHLHQEVARAAGFPTTLAPGLMSADYISELMTGLLGEGWLIGGRLDLSFRRPVLCGDTLTANGRLVERVDEGSFLRHVYQVWCENQRGEVVTVGTASGLRPAG